MLKWSAIVIAILLVMFIGMWVYNGAIVNARVVEELISEPLGARADKVMLLGLPSGKQIPVNYLREGDKIFAGADGSWWRELDGVEVSVIIQGEKINGHAVTILDDPEYTHDVFSRLRPAAPSWLPDWLNGKLVEITVK